jgi:hypothetical protein
MNLILGGDPGVGLTGAGAGSGAGGNQPEVLSVSGEEMEAIERLT